MRYELSVEKHGKRVVRGFRTLDAAYATYDALKAGYPTDTHLVLKDGTKVIAEYKA